MAITDQSFSLILTSLCLIVAAISSLYSNFINYREFDMVLLENRLKISGTWLLLHLLSLTVVLK